MDPPPRRRSDDLNEPLLSVPPVPASLSPSSDGLTPSAKISLILEAENEIRTLERELREVEGLEQRDVVGAGKLAGEFCVLSIPLHEFASLISVFSPFSPEHEPLKAELVQVKKDLKLVSRTYASLEARTNALLTRYNDYVILGLPSRDRQRQTDPSPSLQISTLSEIFVSWNDIVSAAEDAVTKLEKERNKELDFA